MASESSHSYNGAAAPAEDVSSKEKSSNDNASALWDTVRSLPLEALRVYAVNAAQRAAHLDNQLSTTESNRRIKEAQHARRSQQLSLSTSVREQQLRKSLEDLKFQMTAQLSIRKDHETTIASMREICKTAKLNIESNRTQREELLQQVADKDIEIFSLKNALCDAKIVIEQLMEKCSFYEAELDREKSRQRELEKCLQQGEEVRALHLVSNLFQDICHRIDSRQSNDCHESSNLVLSSNNNNNNDDATHHLSADGPSQVDHVDGSRTNNSAQFPPVSHRDPTPSSTAISRLATKVTSLVAETIPGLPKAAIALRSISSLASILPYCSAPTVISGTLAGDGTSSGRCSNLLLKDSPAAALTASTACSDADIFEYCTEGEIILPAKAVSDHNPDNLSMNSTTEDMNLQPGKTVGRGRGRGRGRKGGVKRGCGPIGNKNIQALKRKLGRPPPRLTVGE